MLCTLTDARKAIRAGARKNLYPGQTGIGLIGSEQRLNMNGSGKT